MFNVPLPPLDPLSIAIRVVAAFFALILHEMVKARCSTLLGDPTPRNNGLLSGKPLKYLEPIGFIVTVIFRFGWGRPTPTSPLYYKDRKKGVIITYLTPSLVNLLVGLSAALLVGVFTISAPQLMLGNNPAVNIAIRYGLALLAEFARVNIGIALFNMIPVPPLDAAKLLQIALSPNAAVKMTQNEKVLQVVLMLLLLIGVVSTVINPIIEFMVRAAAGAGF